MKKKIFENLLNGNDLRSIGQSEKLINFIKNQNDFDILFDFLNSNNRVIIMRAIDCIEKITREKNEYLSKHKNKIIDICRNAKNKELKWHLAQLISRIYLNEKELIIVFNTLKEWLEDKKESKIVRVNTLETLYEISKNNQSLKEEFNKVLLNIKKENISSLNARIKKLNI